MNHPTTVQLIDEYQEQLKSVNQQLRNAYKGYDAHKIKVLKSMKKDLQYSISLMKKHQ